MTRRLRTTLLATALALPLLAHAWGFEGHRMIAGLAEAQLSPAARAGVAKLLALEPGATLVSISTWADENRTKENAAWHYVNINDENCQYQRERDCAGDACVVEALPHEIAVLKSGASDAERLTALKFVVHLVGDVHQPLHAGHGQDKGGNTYQVQAFGRGTNLHSVWDTGLIMNHAGGPDQLRSELAAQLIGEAAPITADAQGWATESCRIVNEPGFYPADHKIGAEYQQAHEAELDARLKLAAQRLAGVLNGVFAS